MSDTGNRLVWPIPFSVDASGVPRVGAQLFFYETGTNTPQNTYQDAALTVPNANPIIADDAGQFGNIFLLTSPAYKVVLEDINNVVIWTADPVGFASVISNGFPVGGMIAFGGASPPAGWYLCYGQAVSRTTYAALFTVITTTYGVGDGTTTFNLPDRRGRVPVGKDNMGGSAANRVTFAGSGLDGLTLGAVGGSQYLMEHDHGITDPGHTHTITDPGHVHPEANSGNFFAFRSGGNSNVLSGSTFGGDVNTGSAQTGITATNSGTIDIANTDNAGAGATQNVQPSIIDNWMIFAGA
jgi:microcystin-dependent protein